MEVGRKGRKNWRWREMKWVGQRSMGSALGVGIVDDGEKN